AGRPMPRGTCGQAYMQAAISGLPTTRLLNVRSGSLDECYCPNVGLRHGQARCGAISDVRLHNAAVAADLEIVGDHDHARRAVIALSERALQRDSGMGHVD